jgi:hypothetical protein
LAFSDISKNTFADCKPTMYDPSNICWDNVAPAVTDCGAPKSIKPSSPKSMGWSNCCLRKF